MRPQGHGELVDLKNEVALRRLRSNRTESKPPSPAGPNATMRTTIVSGIVAFYPGNPHPSLAEVPFGEAQILLPVVGC